MRRPLQWLLLFSLVFVFSRPALAQPVLDPNFLEFTASADHDGVGTNGAPLVQRYDFLLYALGSPTPVLVVGLGKPAPDAARTIRIALSAILSPLPAGGITYEVRIAAVGPGGSTPSSPSNGFTFQVTCTYSVSPASRSIGSSGGSSTFSVTAPTGCAWTASSGTNWITITGGASGSGNGSVAFTAAANPTTSSRNGSMTIAGQTRAVNQAGAPCTFSVSPTSQSAASAGGNVSFAVTTMAGCSWTASEQSSWISIASGGTRNGNGTVTFTVARHTGTQPRSTTATVAGRSVAISQRVATVPSAPTGMRVVKEE